MPVLIPWWSANLLMRNVSSAAGRAIARRGTRLSSNRSCRSDNERIRSSRDGDTAGAHGGLVVLRLFLRASCRILRTAAAARPDGHCRRREKSALVVYGDLSRHDRRATDLWRVGG